jgi:hypothetical protein
MTRPRRSRLDDPTAERAADPVSRVGRPEDEECVHRVGRDRCYTPRRYEQPVSEEKEKQDNC